MVTNHQAPRMQLDLRDLVSKYIEDGYEITSRAPLTLIRGRHMRYLENGVLKESMVPQMREVL
tara:strand:- start:7201 stop:7389 length:189 start_codon:yes stop_codon:yes gene_type:complete